MSDMCLASAGDDIKIWDGHGFTLRRQFNPHTNNVSCISWAHDNTALASTSTDGDKIVLTYNDNASYEFAEGTGRTCVAYNSTSRYIMGGGKDGTIQVWDLKTRKLKKTYENHKGRVTSLRFNWNDTDIASGSESGEVIMHNVVSGMASKPLIIAQKTQAIQQVSFSHFKKSLLGAVSDDGAVNLWDVNKRILVHSFAGCHKAPATGLAFSPLNEMLLLSCGLDKRIVCYDVQGKKQVRTMTAESPLTSIDLMNDGATLAVGSTRGKIYIYDLRQGATPIQTLAAHKSSVQGLTFQHAKNTKTDSIGSAKSSRKPLSNVNNNTASAQTEEISKAANHRHINGVSGTEAVPDVAASNQINNNTDAGVSEVFSPIRDSPAKNATDKSASPVPQQNSSLNKYSDGVFSPLADENSSSRRTTGEGVSPFLLSKNAQVPTYSDGVFSPLADENLSNRHSTNEGVSPYLRTRHVPDGSIPEGAPSPMATSQSHGSLSHHVQNSRSSKRLSDHSLDGMKERLMSISPQHHRLNGELSCSEPCIPKATALPNRTSPHKDPTPLHGKHLTPSMRLPEPNIPSQSQISTAVAQRLGQTALEGACAAPEGSDINITSFQMDVLRNLVEDAMGDFRDQVRKDILNLHVEMIKLFQIQQAEMRGMLEQYSVNGELMEEIHRLREENNRLKSKF